MIYLQMGILILEIGLCMLLNNLLKNKTNKKIRYAICIALLLNCWNMRTYQAMWAVHTLFCLLVLLIVFKKRKPIICILLSAIISTSSLLALWICIPSIRRPATSSWTINPEEQKKILKTISTFNSADILITDKCFHSLILTTYNPILPVITEKKHSSTTQKSLVQALLIGVFL